MPVIKPRNEGRAFWGALIVIAIVAVTGLLFSPGVDRDETAGVDGDSAESIPGAGGNASPARSSTAASGNADDSESAEDGAQTDSDEDADPDATAASAVASGRSIPVPAEFADALAGDGDLAEFHRRLENEEQDALWALPLEQYLESHFNSTLDSAEFNVASIECRATLCEVLAIGYSDDALRGWMTSVTDLFESEDQFEALMGGAGTANCGGGDFAPGIMTLNCTFARVDPAVAEVEPTISLSIDAPYSDGQPVAPIEVADEVVSAIEHNLELYNLHRTLEREAVDYEWSNYIEPLLGEYLDGLESAQSMTVHRITCRTTLCEVQMSAPDEVTFIEWLPDMLDFQRQDWHDLTTAGLDGSGDVAAGEPSGIVWYLERRP